MTDQNQIVNEENPIVQQEVNIIEQQAINETPQQINWKKFREERETERKKKIEAEKIAAQKAAEAEALKAAMDAILNQKAMPRQQYDDEEENEDVKIQKKVEAALLERERMLEKQRHEREKAEMPERLSRTYNDFNKVCTTENLDYLEYHYPEVAEAFKYTPDSFEKWAAIYKAVKRFIPNSDSKRDQVKAEKNFNKPQAISVGGITQTGDTPPIMLDEKRRASNWERMQRVMKGGR